MEKIKLQQMQAECIEVNIILHDVQKQLGLKLNDTELLNWTECGTGEYITELFKLATGRIPNVTECEPGLIRVETLEDKHIRILAWSHKITEPMIENTCERLEWIKTLIDKYDFEVVDGKIVICDNDIVLARLDNTSVMVSPDINGSYIKKERKSRGWSQAEFAARIGVALRTVVNYEAGKPIPFSKKPLISNVFKNSCILFAK